jgi:beta-phosphoglucomutase-like phosphatase (HAD superfamily)
LKALIFDLDGTLIDSVYAHTLAWQRALAEIALDSPACEIHRHIGISGKLLARGIARQHGRTLNVAALKRLEARHGVLLHDIAVSFPPLPGARELLGFLSHSNIPHGIATSGKKSEIAESLKALELNRNTVVVDGSSVKQAKPDADLFTTCRKRLGASPSQCLIVGDAVWDVHAARRAGILAVGVLTGGAGEQELYNAGAMRVYSDVGALHRSIDELAILR